jgi:Family of unknown function (DUF6624)
MTMEPQRSVEETRDALAAELIAMAEEDQRVRAELLAEGVLFDGYQPRMAEVHHRNALRLSAIMNEIGWPGRSVVSREAADAAWLVLQHAIGDPPVMRRGLELLSSLPMGEVDPIQVAMLEDRIRCYSGLPQIYGTQFDWDERGEMQPRPIEDAAHVDARRTAIGLPPLAEKLREIRDSLRREAEKVPGDAEARRREIDAWERSVGWRD